MKLQFKTKLTVYAAAMGLMVLLIIAAAAFSWWHTSAGRERQWQTHVGNLRIDEQFHQLIKQLFNNTLATYAERHEPADWEQFLKTCAALEAWIDEQKSKSGTPLENDILKQIAAAYGDFRAAAQEVRARVEAFPQQPTQVKESSRVRAVRERLTELGQSLAAAHQESMHHPDAEANQSLAHMLLLLGALALVVVFGIRLSVLDYRNMFAPMRSNLVEIESLNESRKKLAARGVLTDSVAHELDASIAAIKDAFSRQSKKAEPGFPDRAGLDLADREITRLEDIVRDLVQASRPAELWLATLPAEQPEPEAHNLVMAGVLALCVVVTAMAVLLMRSHENQVFINRFQRDAENRVIAVRREMQMNVDLVQSIASFHASGEVVERKKFRQLVAKPIARHPGLLSLQWAPRVAAAERAAFEEEERQHGQPGFEIKEKLNPGMELVRAADREEYFPVRFLEPFGPNAAAQGFDVRSNPELRDELIMARDSGRPAMSRKMKLFQGGEGFLFAVPIYQDDNGVMTMEERRARLTGFCLGVFRLQALMGEAFKGLGPPGVNVALLDLTAPAGERLLYSEWADDPGARVGAMDEQAFLEAGSQWHWGDVEVGDRHWSVRCAPAPAYRPPLSRWQSRATLGVGIGLTVCLGLAFRLPRRRALTLASQVNQRTQELADAHRRLQRETEERRHVDHALLQSQIQLQAVLDNTEAVVYGKDREGRYLLINRRFERLFSITQAEILGRKDSDVFPKEIADKLHENDMNVLSTGAPSLIEENVPHQDGLHTYISTKFPLADSTGKAYAIFGISTDITERKRMEEALRSSEERYALVINGVHDGIWDWDLTTNRVYFSPHWKSMLGYAEVEVENNFGAWQALLHPEDRERTALRIQEFFDSRCPLYEMDHRLRHKDGTYRWILARGVASRDAQGVVTRLAGSHVDVTERKNSEQRLRRANEALTERGRELLEAMVKLETAHHELLSTRQQLSQAEKLASLGVLAAGVAHEIRNPLTAIKAALFLLLKKVQPGSLEQSDLELVSREIIRLEHIVRDFLQFARPAEPQLVTSAADQPLHQVQELLTSSLAQKNIRLLHEDSTPARIKIDPDQIKQVLINLVQNAADAIGQDGKITLCARLDSRVLAGRTTQVVVLEVSDTGPGIPPEFEKNLFVPFSSTKGGGTGLGLSIAARIVEKHGGILQYQTELNHGTTFGVVLPRADA